MNPMSVTQILVTPMSMPEVFVTPVFGTTSTSAKATRVTGASSAYPILYPSSQRPALHRRTQHLTPGGSP